VLHNYNTLHIKLKMHAFSACIIMRVVLY
jgi:hypothetical protein